MGLKFFIWWEQKCLLYDIKSIFAQVGPLSCPAGSPALDQDMVGLSQGCAWTKKFSVFYL